MNRLKILGIGINTMDIYRHERKMYPGGNEFNIAYHAASFGAHAAFMGVFSRTDPLSGILYHTLEEIGVDLSHSRFEEGTSGFAVIDLVDGDRKFVDWNKKSVTDLHPFLFTASELQYIKDFDVVCMSRCSRVDNEKVCWLARQGAVISYDFCDDYTEEDIKSLSPCLKLAFVSGSHLQEKQVKELLREIVKRGTGTAVATRGAESSIAYDGQKYVYQPCVKVKAVDTMGAGDSFISRFLVTYLTNQEKELGISLYDAAKFAAKTVQKRGSLGIGYDLTEEQMERLFRQIGGSV